MVGSWGWDPGRPLKMSDGNATVPHRMNSGGYGQLQVLLMQGEEEKKLNPFIVGKSMQDHVGEIDVTTTEPDMFV